MKDAVAQDPGVVDQDVDPPEGLECGFDDFVGVARLADRQRRRNGLAACLFDLVDDGLRRPRIGAGAFEARADIADHDARALGRHQQRDAASDPASRAGDDGDFTRNDVWHE